MARNRNEIENEGGGISAKTINRAMALILLVSLAAIFIFTVGLNLFAILLTVFFFIFIWGAILSPTLGLFMIPFLVVLAIFAPLIGIATGVSLPTTDVTTPFSQFQSGLSDFWMLITFQQIPCWAGGPCEVITPATQVGTAYALEFTSFDILPKESIPSMRVDAFYTLENKGDNTATLLDVGISIPYEMRQYGGYIIKAMPSVSTTISNLKEFPELTSGTYNTAQPTEIRSDAILRDAISIVAPACSGSFTVSAYADFNYTVAGISNIKLISLLYYEELITQDKLVQEDREPYSSSGPFKLTVKTSRSQPIPFETYTSGVAGQTATSKTEASKFRLFLRLDNQQSGSATLKDVDLRIPDTIMPDNTTVATAAAAPYCDFFEWRKIGNVNIYKLKALYTGFDSSHGPWTETSTTHDWKTELVNESVILAQQMTLRSCDFMTNTSRSGEVIKERTVTLTANLTYNYHTTKDATFMVKGGTSCTEYKKNAAIAKKMVFEKGVPQPKEAVLGNISAWLCGCASSFGDWENRECRSGIFNIIGCDATSATNGQITGKEINGKMSSTWSGLKCGKVENQNKIYFFENEIKIEDPSKWIIDPAKTYSISIAYKTSGVSIWGWRPFGGDQWIEVRATSSTDSTECSQAENSPCLKNDNKACSSGNCGAVGSDATKQNAATSATLTFIAKIVALSGGYLTETNVRDLYGMPVAGYATNICLPAGTTAGTGGTAVITQCTGTVPSGYTLAGTVPGSSAQAACDTCQVSTACPTMCTGKNFYCTTGTSLDQTDLTESQKTLMRQQGYTHISGCYCGTTTVVAPTCVYTDCSTCKNDANCKWCTKSGLSSCIPATSSVTCDSAVTSTQGTCTSAATCSAIMCSACASCATCRAYDACAWCATTNKCSPLSDFPAGCGSVIAQYLGNACPS